MKQLLLTLMISCFGFLGMEAQKTEGIITFEEKINMHRSLPPEASEMKAMIPEFRSHNSELLFNETESLYRNAEEEDDDEMGDGQVMIKMQRPETFFYRNFSTKKRIDSREFMGKTYLIEDSLSNRNWKITGATKKILDYNCMSAVTSDTTRKQEITAWFTDALPLPSGPSAFGQLPGTILEVNINDGAVVMAAKKIEFKKLKKNELSAPKKGEKTTDEGFNKIVDDRMKEMGGGGPIRIIRN